MVAATSISKPELFDWKLCLISQQTAVFTPYIVILITVTTKPGVCAWAGHSTRALTIDRCSAPVRHFSRITWHPPSVWTFIVKQNCFQTLIFDELFTVWRNSGETGQLRQTWSCVMCHVSNYLDCHIHSRVFCFRCRDLSLSRQLHSYQSCHRRLWTVPGLPRHLDQWRNVRLHCWRISLRHNRKQ